MFDGPRHATDFRCGDNVDSRMGRQQSLALGASSRARRPADSLSVANPAPRGLGREGESDVDEKGTRSGAGLGGPLPSLWLGDLAGEHREATRIGVDFSRAWPTAQGYRKRPRVSELFLLDLSPGTWF